jgi:hypothetical protein
MTLGITLTEEQYQQVVNHQLWNGWKLLGVIDSNGLWFIDSVQLDLINDPNLQWLKQLEQKQYA